ncbi:hypothetical protein FHX44_117752 [Pseudonocardia hierapolitana]|uniref:Uncharacterized protein n=1 Tax=Pseudonocardia hierapolitana TaxID=1128676 RepID=A0A561T3X3_9PSEU|nr:DUF6463 family protein [Pseudonocardia hierapolitana]TWF81807.1 hypothetical protein FHX44_117752 [Pseudonocardia hierapolitana]
MPIIDTQSEATTSRTWWRNPSAWGGLLAMCGGVFHTVVAALMRQDVWAQIIDEGFFNTVTLEPSADRLAAAEAFWFSVGSFGVPLLLLGSLVTWLIRRGVPVPGWLGCGLAAWAVLIGLVSGFDGGTLILLTIGALLAAGAWTARRAPGPLPRY